MAAVNRAIGQPFSCKNVFQSDLGRYGMTMASAQKKAVPTGAEGSEPRKVRALPSKEESLGDLLSFYYPMHFRIGMDLEQVMGQGRISRKQAAILWLIHSRADAKGWLRRKAIEDRLSTWFEISNSSISNLLRELTRPPLQLALQKENPDSGREKLVRLTPAGEEFVADMIKASISYLGKHLKHLPPDELAKGIEFFKLAFNPIGQDAEDNSDRD